MKSTVMATALLAASILLGVHLGSAADTTLASQTDATISSPGHAEASYIIQASSADVAAAAVESVGGTVTHELDIIAAVAATLTSEQRARLEQDSRLTVSKNASAAVAGKVKKPKVAKSEKSKNNASKPWQSWKDRISSTTRLSDPYVVTHTKADHLHSMGITGHGVTIAFVDTGLWDELPVASDSSNNRAFLQGYNSINNELGADAVHDAFGHGTHVVSVAGNSRADSSGTFIGMAPDASKVIVKSFDDQGNGTYADAIRGLDWILKNRHEYNIRVVNLSFGATAQSHYWNDPLNLAVMKLWQAGIVVVASSGNWGPQAQSVTVPGNVPYVITVGAMTNNFTIEDETDDRLASFSGVGPTYEGFVKPDLVAPGGHITGLMSVDSKIAREHPDFFDMKDYFFMSGTSQSAAVVSGAIALMLQAEPALTPDDIKCRLYSSSEAARAAQKSVAYSVFQQGAGQLNAYEAVFSNRRGCANTGLDINADLNGTKHFGGAARQDADGNFYITDPEGAPVMRSGYLWTDGYLWTQGYLWTNGSLGNQASFWSQGYLWTEGYLWTNGNLWSADFVASPASTAGVNHWVVQE